jgi:aspartyl-tRNA(Asn)/glutamyl-tRNA(Gln) amidotransferase subunit A
VRVRIERGREVSAADYLQLIDARRRLIARFKARLAPYDAWLMPTVAKLAPPLAVFANDREFARRNAQILRNPALVNFLDGCAATVPVAHAGELPVGLSVAGAHGRDAQVLRIALAVEGTYHGRTRR